MTDMIEKIEFGDFQTPQELADEICSFLSSCNLQPDHVLEPTCGDGAFIVGAFKHFPSLRRANGYDINPLHLANASRALSEIRHPATLERQDFFDANWSKIMSVAGERPLVLGNLPWVTSARLGSMNSSNLPQKSNFQSHQGFAAKTGKANFDISEWMLIKLLDASFGRRVDIAILCKVATARKVLKYAWSRSYRISSASVHAINAQVHFGASVTACLLFLRLDPSAVPTSTAEQYAGLNISHRTGQIGIVNSELVSDLSSYSQFSFLDGTEHQRWRSGIKHDASSVMELDRRAGKYFNKLGQECQAETIHIFPFLKSSDVANGRVVPVRFVLVPQFRTTDDTSLLAHSAPHLWQYLESSKEYLDCRKSSIYRNRPKYAIFGVGDYSFSPWKVAVAGLYKSFHFVKLGSFESKPILLDDTCYFLSFDTEERADLALELLKSRPAQAFLRSLTFFDAKRPITIDVLKRLDLIKLSKHLGVRSPIVTPLIARRVRESDGQGVLSF
jgi:hypothetical protein